LHIFDYRFDENRMMDAKRNGERETRGSATGSPKFLMNQTHRTGEDRGPPTTGVKE
jgi:hypothetical protein